MGKKFSELQNAHNLLSKNLQKKNLQQKKYNKKRRKGKLADLKGELKGK